MALPAIAAAAAPPCSNRSISSTRRAHSSKAAARCCSRRMGQTDGRTDGQTLRRTDTVPLHKPCSAYYADSADNTKIATFLTLYTSNCIEHCMQMHIQWHRFTKYLTVFGSTSANDEHCHVVKTLNLKYLFSFVCP